jgi:tripartite ATP-independent transporter DctM subunit
MTLALLVILLLLLIFIGVPIAFSIGLSSLAVIMIEGLPIAMVPQKILYSVDSFVFLAVPFFILAGELMEKGGISKRLVNLAKVFIGRIRGGLGIVSVISSMIFAGLSGSAVADASAIGSITIPAMKKQGYKKEFAVSLQASAAVLGPIIPPSVLMIIYCSMTDLSVQKMFTAGIVPGIVIGLGLMFAVYIIAVKRGLPKENRLTAKEKLKYIKESILAVMMPVIILVGISTGLFTPTEAGVVAVVYALIVSILIYKEVKIKELKSIILSAVKKTAMCMLIVASASIFAWILAIEQVPASLAAQIVALTSSPALFILIIIVFNIFIGTIMDTMAAAIILTPIFAPLAVTFGFDPIHFGLIVLMSLIVGMATPPVGVVLYITCGIGETKIHTTTKYIFLFAGIMMLAIILVALLPDLAMFLPNLMAK